MNIYQKLIEVRKQVEFLVKDEQGYQYKYVSGSSLLNTIRPKMDELGLMLITDVISAKHERHTFEGVDNKGNAKTFIQFVVNMELQFTWVNADNPEEKLVCKWVSSGEDEDPAKAEGKAYTYGERYFGLKFFKVATDNEDPDVTQKVKDPLQTITRTTQPMTTLKDRVEGTGIAKFGSKDAFKTFRVDNNLKEDLATATDTELNHILNIVREYKK